MIYGATGPLFDGAWVAVHVAQCRHSASTTMCGFQKLEAAAAAADRVSNQENISESSPPPSTLSSSHSPFSTRTSSPRAKWGPKSPQRWSRAPRASGPRSSASCLAGAARGWRCRDKADGQQRVGLGSRAQELPRERWVLVPVLTDPPRHLPHVRPVPVRRGPDLLVPVILSPRGALPPLEEERGANTPLDGPGGALPRRQLECVDDLGSGALTPVNNYAFGLKIPVTVHIIFRSGGELAFTMRS